MRHLVSFVLALIMGLSSAMAQGTLSEQDAAGAKIGLITCGPSDAYAFTLYGHSGILVQMDGRNVVFNYGLFSFDQPNFIWNFSMGQPLYKVGAQDLEDFLEEYRYYGRRVTVQELNLNTAEKIKIITFLQKNILPENCEYVYNFYFNNCATKPRDIIEMAVGPLVAGGDNYSYGTFRQAIRGMTFGDPWYTWLCDVPLGWKTDRHMTSRDVAFLPTYLEQQVDQAVRKDNGKQLMLNKKDLLPQINPVVAKASAKWWRPWTVTLLIVLIYIALRWFFLKTRNEAPLKVWRSLLYLAVGAGGVIVWFLGLFSHHPHTFPNLNMLLFHPLWLILVVTIWLKSCRTLNNRLYFINFALLVVYLVVGLTPLQILPESMWMLALLLCVDSSGPLVPFIKQRKKQTLNR